MLSRFQRFKQNSKSHTVSNKLQSTSGGSSGGITLNGLLVEIRHPPQRTAGSLNFKVIVTEGSGQVIPAARKKDKLTGEYTQEQYDVDKMVPENGSIISLSMYMQATDVFEADVFQIVTVCGVVRNGDYINAKKVLTIGDWHDAPSYTQNIPTPWDMHEKDIKYLPVPFIVAPIEESIVSQDSGNVFFSTYDSGANSSKFLSDEGNKILPGPFRQKKWTPDIEQTCDVSMSLWNPKANLEQFGIINDEAWKALASQFTTNMHARGVMTISNNEGKSSSLLGNTDQNPDDYAVVAYCSRLDVDLLATLKSSAVEVTPDFVKKHFEDEDVIESEYATENPLAKTTSQIICLSEWTGSLKKVFARKDATFYVLANFKTDEDKQTIMQQDIESRGNEIKNTTTMQYIYVYLSKGSLKKGKRER